MNINAEKEEVKAELSDLKRVPVAVTTDLCGAPELIAMFDGWRSLEEIIENSPYPKSEVEDFVYSHIAQKKIVWKDGWSPLFWCKSCDLPIFSKKCDLCGGHSNHQIDLKYPCNPRLTLPHDEHMLKSVGLPWPFDASLIINSYITSDHWGWELIHGGKVIGDIIQTNQNSKFKFVPAPDFTIGSLVKRDVSVEDLIKANKSRLDELEKEAIVYINSYKVPYKVNMPILGFSGGKDSVVLAHIASMTKFWKIIVTQINTGIEPEYNDNFAEDFLKSKKKFILKRFASGDIFWKAIKKMGPHAFDFQWCRTILKQWSIYREKPSFLGKLFLFIGYLLGTEVVILHGARNREDIERVTLPRSISLNGSHPTIPGAPAIAILPLASWTDADIWMYMYSRNLPINPSYTKDKSQRSLCMFCWEKNDYEFENDIKAYPDVYAKLEAELKVWQKKFNFPDEWITKRLWRYTTPNSEYMKKLNIIPTVGSIADELERAVTFGDIRTGNGLVKVEGKIHIEFNIKDLAKWFKAFGKVSINNNGFEVLPDFTNVLEPLGISKSDKINIKISDNGIVKIISKASSIPSEFIKLTQGWILVKIHCIGCGGCVKDSDKKIYIDEGEAIVTKKLPLKLMREIFKACPVHREGINTMQRPLNKEFSGTSCSSCHIRYNRDMNFVKPVESPKAKK